MMSYGSDTDLKEYPELDSEAEEIPSGEDDRPVSSQPLTLRYSQPRYLKSSSVV